MNRQKTLIMGVFLAMVAATAGLINHTKGNQKMGAPGVLTQAQPGQRNLKVLVPEHVPGYSAELTSQPQIVLDSLPTDTSFGRCLYTAPDGFQILLNVVLMGTDRTSIHKPQVCLTSQGWRIDDSASKVDMLAMTKPFPYQLPVMRLVTTLQTEIKGKPTVLRGVYVYWFVDGNKFTARHVQRMWWMARDMLASGVLDRFAYISYFSVCEPGQEAATFERMKKIIIESVPEFQLVPRGETAMVGEIR